MDIENTHAQAAASTGGKELLFKKVLAKEQANSKVSQQRTINALIRLVLTTSHHARILRSILLSCWMISTESELVQLAQKTTGGETQRDQELT